MSETKDSFGVVYSGNKLETAYGASFNERKYVVEDGIEIIGNDAFTNISSLVSVTLPDTIVEIGESAFNNCENLRVINFPSSLKKIGNKAFWGCKKLENGDLPDTMEEIGEMAFCGCQNIKKLHIPLFLKTIVRETFEECWGIKAITFEENAPSNLREIQGSAFAGCKALEKVTLPEGLVVIKNCVFKDCDNLKEMLLPKSLREIGSLPSGLEKLIIQSSDIKLRARDLKKLYDLKIVEVPTETLSYYQRELSSLGNIILKCVGDNEQRLVIPKKEPGRIVSRDLEILIDSALESGEISEKNMAIIQKRAQAEGTDPDELELLIEGKLSRIRKIQRAKEASAQRIAKLEEESRKREEESRKRIKEMENQRILETELRRAEMELQAAKLQAEREEREARMKIEQEEREARLKEDLEPKKNLSLKDRLQGERVVLRDTPERNNHVLPSKRLEKKIEEIRDRYLSMIEDVQDELFYYDKDSIMSDYRQYKFDKESKTRKLMEARNEEIKGAIQTLHIEDHPEEIYDMLIMLDSVIGNDDSSAYGPDVKKAYKNKYKICLEMAANYPNDLSLFNYMENVKKREEKAQKQSEEAKKRREKNLKAQRKLEEELSRQTAARFKKEVEQAKKGHYDTYFGESDIIVTSREKKCAKAVASVIEGFRLPTDKNDLLGLIKLLNEYSNKKLWEKYDKWEKKMAESHYKKYKEAIDLAHKLFPSDPDFSHYK